MKVAQQNLMLKRQKPCLKILGVNKDFFCQSNSLCCEILQCKDQPYGEQCRKTIPIYIHIYIYTSYKIRPMGTSHHWGLSTQDEITGKSSAFFLPHSMDPSKDSDLQNSRRVPWNLPRPGRIRECRSLAVQGNYGRRKKTGDPLKPLCSPYCLISFQRSTT